MIYEMFRTLFLYGRGDKLTEYLFVQNIPCQLVSVASSTINIFIYASIYIYRKRKIPASGEEEAGNIGFA